MSKREIEIVRDILVTKWDPLEIRDVKEASDEYDIYAPKLLSVAKLRNLQAVVDQLNEIEVVEMQITVDAERNLEVALLILSTLFPER